MAQVKDDKVQNQSSDIELDKKRLDSKDICGEDLKGLVPHYMRWEKGLINDSDF